MATRTNTIKRGIFMPQERDRHPRINKGKRLLGSYSQYRKMENLEKHRLQG